MVSVLNDGWQRPRVQGCKDAGADSFGALSMPYSITAEHCNMQSRFDYVLSGLFQKCIPRLTHCIKAPGLSSWILWVTSRSARLNIVLSTCIRADVKSNRRPLYHVFIRYSRASKISRLTHLKLVDNVYWKGSRVGEP